MNNLNILIVEDEIELRSSYVEYFKLYFKKIYLASNGEDALLLFKNQSIDIIFTDINMPKLDGISFIKQIRSIDTNVHIIIISAYESTDYLIEAIELNLITYLIKPVKIIDFKNTIEKIITKLDKSCIELNHKYRWNTESLVLYLKNKKINLSNYEILFLDCLIKNKNKTVSHFDLHNYIYDDIEFTKDTLPSLVKRLRAKTSKNFITSSYKEGYKIEM